MRSPHTYVEEKISETFKRFDVDGSNTLDKKEFLDLMRVMRTSTSRGKATGMRTGLKCTGKVEDLGKGGGGGAG